MKKLAMLLMIIALILVFITVVIGILLITHSGNGKIDKSDDSVITGGISGVQVEKVYDYPLDERVIKKGCGCGK